MRHRLILNGANPSRTGLLASAICVATFLFTLQMTAVHADQNPVTFAQAVERYGGEGTPMWGLLLKENFLAPAPSALYKLKQNGARTESTLCTGLSDTTCLGEDLYQILRLDPCNADSQLSCLGEMWAVDPSGKRIDGNFLKVVPFETKQFVRENIPSNLPASTSFGSLWQLPNVKNTGQVDTYLAITFVTMFKKASESKFTYGGIDTSIFAVEELRGNYGMPVLLPNGGFQSTGATSTPDGRECLTLENGICQAPVQFPNGYRFGITLKMGEKLNGWFHGRMSLPQISIKTWKSGQEIRIEGEPVKVSSLDFVVPKSQLTEKQVKSFEECITASSCGGRGTISGVAQTGSNLSHPNSLRLITEFASAFKDRATSTASTWAFRNMFNHAGSIDSGKINSCSRGINSLNGIVLTNALAYSSGPPSFDEKTGSLVYQVASPHFEENGSVASGTYDLTIRSDVARCIYDFSNAPIKAEVSITGSDGENRVATTLVNEKDGWFYLSAKGFTFSSPTIRVKLTQDRQAELSQGQNDPKRQLSSPVVKSTMKKSINCVKGKVTKKVTGVSPKCPTGFKIKK